MNFQNANGNTLGLEQIHKFYVFALGFSRDFQNPNGNKLGLEQILKFYVFALGFSRDLP